MKHITERHTAVFTSSGAYAGFLVATSTGTAAVDRHTKQVWHGADASRGAARLRALATGQST
jgi:hypothetical protein